MSLPAASLYRPKASRFDAALHQITQMFAKTVDRETPVRSVADLLEFGYAVTQSDFALPHRPS